MRFRPSNDPVIGHLVHIVNGYRGGSYGFYSGHASNSFAVAVFMIVMVRKLRKIIIPVCLLFACIVSYSRIYLGVHYPLDVIAGALAGSMIAFCISWMLQRAMIRVNGKESPV
jgi:undecaprenyl-diphosphatase